MAAARSTRRRPFQFGIGTMFLMVTVLAVWLGWELKFIRERRDFLALLDRYRMAEIEAAAGRPVFTTVLTPSYEDAIIPFWRRWLGDQAHSIILLPDNTSERDLQQARLLFPEAKYFAQNVVTIRNE